jgi:uncharacterized protein (DUF2267 family)
MQYAEFIKAIEERADVAGREEAEKTAVVVLQTLSDRLAGGEAKDLLSQLPKELKERVESREDSNPIGPEEFVARVASELDIPEEEARARVHAVFATIREAVTPGEFDDVMSQLDRDYAGLL